MATHRNLGKRCALTQQPLGQCWYVCIQEHLGGRGFAIFIFRSMRPSISYAENLLMTRDTRPQEQRFRTCLAPPIHIGWLLFLDQTTTHQTIIPG